MNKKKIALGVMMILGTTAGVTAQAAMLQTGDLLTIAAGVAVYDQNNNPVNVSGGSYFVCDCNGNLSIQNVEKSAITPGTDGGIRIGFTQSSGQIDDYYQMFNIPGRHYTSVAVTGGTTTGLNFSGWNMDWNSMTMPLGTSAWTPTNCATVGVSCAGYANGVAVFNWNGIYGGAYTLDYTARVPQGHPSGFDSVPFFLHLEGTVASIVPSVPLPAAVWLFGSGLFGLMGAARLQRSAE